VHLYSNAPKEFRKYLKIEGEEVVEIDIKSSQPSFLYVLLIKGYLFKKEFRDKIISNYPQDYLNMLSVVKSGDKLDFYNYMAIRLYGLGYAKNKNVRSQMKTLFYQIVFGKPVGKLAGLDKKVLIIKLFGEGFYIFLVELSNQKLDLIKDHYKNLSKLLQKKEADIINMVMNKLDIPFLPLYDSLIVKKKDANQAIAAFNDIFKEQGLAHILKVK
jgi:bifunctional DNA-binding transcriptional regulator/antitoxin component of YhaV-PrlF toxin-antitoxin module